MASSGYQGDRGQDVPFWNGDPSSFASFETACRWYSHTLKESEQAGAAARIWGRLTGPAKSVVKHLDPDQFFHKKGLDLLLEKLRHSLLQTLPIPDSFQKLKRWNNLRRRDNESIPEFLVREEEGFSELQLSLQRSRDLSGRSLASTEKVLREPPAQDEDAEAAAEDEFADLPDFRKASPSSSPSRRARTPGSPTSRPGGAKGAVETAAPDFFSDELRGYRLLKGAGLTVQERQQVLTLSNNKVNFEVIRQALRAFSDDSSEGRRHRHRERAAWWTDEAADDYLIPEDEDYAEDAEEAYWGDPSWALAGTMASGTPGPTRPPTTRTGCAGGSVRGRGRPFSRGGGYP